MNTGNDFKTALKFYQEGNSEKAFAICNDIINREPTNINVIHLLAMLYYQSREYDNAVRYIRKALQIDQHDFYALFFMGNIFHEQEMFQEAITCFQKAAELNPAFADAYYNMAIIFEKLNQFEESLNSYKKSLTLNPQLADVHNNIGNLLLKMKQVDASIPYLREAVRLDPHYVVAFNNLGLALKEKGDFDEAATSLLKAIELDPSSADAYCNLAIIMKGIGKVDEALTYIQKVVEIDPSHANAYYNLGVILKEQGRVDEAVTSLQKAVEIDPSHANAYCNLAIIFEESGRPEDALAYYQKGLQISPDDAEIHWNMSSALLSSGNFEKGWREYEWRLAVKDFKERTFPIPRWDGSSLQGKSLLIYAEQGVGEEIMFASCLPEVIARADQCIVECDKRLLPLFLRSFPDAVMIDRTNTGEIDPSRLSQADMRIASGSLPFFLRPDLSSFPQYQAYLVPDPAKVELWRNRFAALGNELKVGISWRGGGKASEKRLRSTVLEEWAKLFSLAGVHFINLQYGDCSSELEEAKGITGTTVHDWEDADPLKDLDNFAAEISALDLVISVDNATVHMAGALGVPVWVLLPFACDWRWMRGFDDTPWYKTVRLIRQTNPGDWEKVFERVRSDLLQYLSPGTGFTPEVKCSYKLPAIPK